MRVAYAPQKSQPHASASRREVRTIPKKSKERISVSIDQEFLSWLDSKIDERVFASRSHGMEYLLKRQMDREQSSS